MAGARTLWKRRVFARGKVYSNERKFAAKIPRREMPCCTKYWCAYNTPLSVLRDINNQTLRHWYIFEHLGIPRGMQSLVRHSGAMLRPMKSFEYTTKNANGLEEIHSCNSIATFFLLPTEKVEISVPKNWKQFVDKIWGIISSIIVYGTSGRSRFWFIGYTENHYACCNCVSRFS